MPDESLVSICIPTYNRAGMVGKAIDSALAQSYTNIEVLVVDNASGDDIESVIAGYDDSRLQFFKNKENLGLFGNFNRCIELSKGKYIHILNSDDYINSNFTKTCVEFVETHPNVMMTFSSSVVLSDKEPIKVAVSDHDIIYPAPELFRNLLATEISVTCPSVMVRREVYDSVGSFSCEYPYAGDYYQWLKISKKFDAAFVANAIIYYREGDHTETFRLLHKSPLGYIDTIKIFIRIIDELGEEEEAFRRELNIAIRHHMRVCNNLWICRSDRMKSPYPLVFLGLSFNTWALIRSDSIIDRIKKFFDFIFILTIGFFFVLPGARFCLGTVSWLKQKIVRLLGKIKN